MKIYVNQIPEEGLTLTFSKEAAWVEGHLAQDDRAIRAQDAAVTLTVRKFGANVFLEGRIKTALELDCGRCLERASVPVDVAFRYTFTPAGTDTAPGDEVELSEGDLEYGTYSDESINLDPVIFEQIALQVPMQALCREDCRGLCPRCGTNLNTGRCDCKTLDVDARLAVLKNINLKK